MSTVCSFCRKNEKDVHAIVAGPGVWICDECIDLCEEIILKHRGKTEDYRTLIRPGVTLQVNEERHTTYVRVERVNVYDDSTFAETTGNAYDFKTSPPPILAAILGPDGRRLWIRPEARPAAADEPPPVKTSSPPTSPEPPGPEILP